MTRKPTSTATRPANLSPNQLRTALPPLQSRIQELKELDLSQITQGDDERVQALEARIRSTLARIYGEDTHEFTRLKQAAELDDTYYPMIMVLGSGDGPTVTVQEIREGLDRGRKRAIALLSGEVNAIEEALRDIEPVPTASLTAHPNQTENGPIFIVHGHDTPAKLETTRLIERAGLNAVILHEQPNAGRTIIEKFESHGGRAGFAVVVLTPDDVGGPDKNSLNPRARQNVIGEMFWFAGKLGRDRVCALKKGEIEIPSDFVGVAYTDMDDRGAWKTELLRELNAAGYTVDWAKALT